MRIDYTRMAALHAAARRERSHYVYCLLLRATQWLAARWAGKVQHNVPCCAPA